MLKFKLGNSYATNNNNNKSKHTNTNCTKLNVCLNEENINIKRNNKQDFYLKNHGTKYISNVKYKVQHSKQKHKITGNNNNRESNKRITGISKITKKIQTSIFTYIKIYSTESKTPVKLKMNIEQIQKPYSNKNLKDSEHNSQLFYK